MFGRIAIVTMFTLASPAAADFCTEMSGAARGLCNAYCHGIRCGCALGIPDATSTACLRVRERLTTELGVNALPWESRATLSGSGAIQAWNGLRTLTLVGVGLGNSGEAFGTLTWTFPDTDGTVQTMTCVVDQLVPSDDPSKSWCVRGVCDLYGYWASFSILDSHDASVPDGLCGLFAGPDETDCTRSPLAYSLDFAPIVSGDFTTVLAR